MTTQARVLEGRNALVCGASRGIGRACGIEFASLGARVVLVARSWDALAAAREKLGPGEHEILAADFGDPPKLLEAVKRLVARIGPFHILLNNTGGPPSGAIFDATPEAFLSTFTNHLLCNQVLSQAVVPGMKEAGYGRIINIVSTSVKQPIRGLGVSNTVRGAVASWAKTLSVELAPFGITVNNILPGATRTDRLTEIVRERARASGRSDKEIEAEMIREIPMGRIGNPEEVAAAAGFLAGPRAAYITGISLPVDGGRTLAL
jgi:3-oxoacyl-[acyl-carrier protein] reductase